MSNSQNDAAPAGKKLLENSVMGGIMVPIAIVLVGALIVFGVTKLISTDRSHKDLVREMHSKTFGNRWIAAYELSKLISTSQIPEKDQPWLIENLDALYNSSADPRTKDFIIVALGALKSSDAANTILRALGEDDSNIKFHALIALGNLPKGVSLDWSPVISFLEKDDEALKQAAILTLATHRIEPARTKIAESLSSKSIAVRFAAASALVNFKDDRALPVIKEIFTMKAPADENAVVSEQELLGIKLNLIGAVQKNNWSKVRPLIEFVEKNESNLKLIGKAREALNQLKN